MDAPNPMEQALVTFLSQLAPVPTDFHPDTDLLSLGVLDSLLVTDLLLHIESAFQVKLGARDLAPENLRTVRRLAALVTAKQRKPRAAA
jgi:methoxymalonate biosynthesis acyl carrier protein